MANPEATFSMLEAMSARLEIITRSLERTAVAVEANSAQVASLSESITRLEIQIENGFGRIENLIQQQLELSRQQHETAQIQGRHIERLMGVVETLLQRAA
jgi:hypothetical protein